MATENRRWDDDNLRWVADGMPSIFPPPPGLPPFPPPTGQRPDKPGLYWGMIQGGWDLYAVVGVAPFLEIRPFHSRGDYRYSPISVDEFLSWGSEVPRPPDEATVEG